MRTAIVLLLILCSAATAYGESKPAQIDREAFETWFDELSNWGRWGADDQLGTLNLVTPDVRRAAAREVSEGVSVSLARDVEKTLTVDNPEPFGHTMTGVGTRVAGDDGLRHGYGADRFEVNFHGFVHSHIDALCHVFHNGFLYNGSPQRKVTPDGAEVLSVLNMKNGILTRGVLIDLPRLLQVPFLDDDHVITVGELNRWESETKTRIRPGDAVVIRTGRWLKREAKGAWDPMTGSAGVHPRVAYWLKQRDVALIGSDTAMDALPSLVEGSPFPFHELAIVAMGMPILDSLDLEALSIAALEAERNHFMLHVAPLAVGGATGSPVNPIATF
jgi:kynurenine formamidase